MPKATVTTASSLASEVTGSLTSAASLANTLGQWLAIAVLAAAFALAVLLTMSAVARRVREFGTLKALGWRSKRVVGQVMGEALTIGRDRRHRRDRRSDTSGRCSSVSSRRR